MLRLISQTGNFIANISLDSNGNLRIETNLSVIFNTKNEGSYEEPIFDIAKFLINYFNDSDDNIRMDDID